MVILVLWWWNTLRVICQVKSTLVKCRERKLGIVFLTLERPSSASVVILCISRHCVVCVCDRWRSWRSSLVSVKESWRSSPDQDSAVRTVCVCSRTCAHCRPHCARTNTTGITDTDTHFTHLLPWIRRDKLRFVAWIHTGMFELYRTVFISVLQNEHGVPQVQRQRKKKNTPSNTEAFILYRTCTIHPPLFSIHN